MTVTLSTREATTIVAALIAWKDPVAFLSNGIGEHLFDNEPELQPEQIDFLVRRFKVFLSTPAGARHPTKV